MTLPIYFEGPDLCFSLHQSEADLCEAVADSDPFQPYLTPAERHQADGQAPASEAADTDYTGAYPAVWGEDVC